VHIQAQTRLELFVLKENEVTFPVEVKVVSQPSLEMRIALSASTTNGILFEAIAGDSESIGTQNVTTVCIDGNVDISGGGCCPSGDGTDSETSFIGASI
jgi:hypothetical protein